MEPSWDDLVLLHDETSRLWAPARKWAQKFLLEHEVWSWVQRLNFSQGVAPSAADVFHYYESKALPLEPEGQPQRRSINKWAARWRGRWGVRRACLRPADSVDPTLGTRQEWAKKPGHFLGPLLASKCKPLYMFGPRFGAQKRFVFGPPKLLHNLVFCRLVWRSFQARCRQHLLCQVHAFWKSIAYVSHKFCHEQVVWINFDETSVPCCPQCPRGCVVNDWTSYPVPGGPQMRVPKRRRRMAYTHGALICSHPGIQAVLPHYLVCSDKRLPKRVARGFAALPQTQLRLLRGTSSWVTADSMIRILADVRKAIEPWFPMVKPIVLLDTACPHLPQKVMAFAKKKQLQLVYVPASATAPLQPLDVAAFSAFKQWLKRKNQELRRTAHGGEPQDLEFLWQLGQAPRDFFASRCWSHAFASVGCGRDVNKLHSALKDFMQKPEAFPLASKPTAAEMALIFPKKRKMSYASACLFP